MPVKFATTVLIVSVLFIACKSTGGGDHLPAPLMKKVLMDIQMAETYSTMEKDTLHKNMGMKNYDSLAVYYNDIFSHYKITEAQFTQSLTWYKNHPEDLDTMFNDMLPIVTGLQTAAQKAALPAGAPAINAGVKP